MKTSGLDPNYTELHSVKYRRESETHVQYQYWGTRLMKIYEEFEREKGSGSVRRQWLLARSGPAYVILWTIAVFVLTAGAFLVGIFQAQRDRHT